MKNPRAFNLFELVIIAAVLSAFSYSIVPNLTSASSEDDLVIMIDILHQVRAQLDHYRSKFNSPPQPDTDTALLIQLNKVIDSRIPALNRLPANPFNGLRTVRIDTNSDFISGSFGWHYNPQTGRFRADDSPGHANL